MPRRAPAAREHQATPTQGRARRGTARRDPGVPSGTPRGAGATCSGGWEERAAFAGREIGISPCLSVLCRRQGEALGPHTAIRLMGHRSKVLALPVELQQLWKLLATSIFASLSGGATDASAIRGLSCACGECCLPQGAAGTFQSTQAVCSKYRGKNCMVSRRIFLLAAHREMVLQV